MTWAPPTFTEIDMNAEIGAYQDDTDRDGGEPIATEDDAADRR